jgi:xanthine dehydrogenase accessory factor
MPFDDLAQLRRSERRVAVATLVATRGTTPKKEGAKMWVGEGGRILGSVTIGGCVDARVIEESEEVLRTAEPKLLSMSLGDEDAWELGLTCGGTLDVLIERLDFERGDALLDAYETARRETAAGRHAVVVTRLDGGAADRAGAKLVVLEDGSALGSLGEPALDAAARERARDIVRQGRSRTLPLGAEDSPVRAFFDLYGPPPHLVVFGAGQVAMPLVRFARELGWRTTVVDGRPRFANRERFPDADDVRAGIPSEIAEQLTYTPSTSVVLVAHDYKYDIPVLRTVLATDAGYVGLLGSRRRGKAILDFLALDGVPDRALARVHVPIGLDIGAQTATEIALSVLAEAVAVRAGREGRKLREVGGGRREAGEAKASKAKVRRGGTRKR